MHLIGFIITIYHDARPPERQINIFRIVSNYNILMQNYIIQKCGYNIVRLSVYRPKRRVCCTQILQSGDRRCTGVLPVGILNGSG